MTTTDSHPTSVAETLRRARNLIEDPKHWIKGALAKPSKYSRNIPILNPNDPEAGAWCALGAINRVDGPYEDAAVKMLAFVIGGYEYAYVEGARGEVTGFNDRPVRLHADVLSAFDRAIAKAEGA